MATYYDPFREMLSLSDALRLWMPELALRAGEGAIRPVPMNIAEHDNAYIVQVALPGVRPEDVEVTEQQRTLTIHAKRHPLFPGSKDVSKVSYLLQEFDAVEYLRSITLPKEFVVEQIQATFEHGVLTITLPLAQQAKSRKIAISATASKKELAAANGNRA
jgi:HSP20 family protein